MSDQEILTLLGSLAQKIDALVGSADRPARRYLTVAHAAAYCDLSQESIRRLISSRKLSAHRPMRGRVLVDRQELDVLLKASTHNPRGGRGHKSHP